MFFVDLNDSICLGFLHEHIPLDLIGSYGSDGHVHSAVLDGLGIAGDSGEYLHAADGIHIKDKESLWCKVVMSTLKKLFPILKVGEVVDGVEHTDNDIIDVVKLKAGDGGVVKITFRQFLLCNFQHFGGEIDAGKSVIVLESSEEATGAAA